LILAPKWRPSGCADCGGIAAVTPQKAWQEERGWNDSKARTLLRQECRAPRTIAASIAFITTEC